MAAGAAARRSAYHQSSPPPIRSRAVRIASSRPLTRCCDRSPWNHARVTTTGRPIATPSIASGLVMAGQPKASAAKSKTCSSTQPPAAYATVHCTTFRRRSGPTSLRLHALPACRSLGGPHVAGSVREPRTRGATDERAGTWEPAPPQHASGSSGFQLFSFSPPTRGGRDEARRGVKRPPRTRDRLKCVRWEPGRERTRGRGKSCVGGQTNSSGWRAIIVRMVVRCVDSKWCFLSQLRLHRCEATRRLQGRVRCSRLRMRRHQPCVRRTR